MTSHIIKRYNVRVIGEAGPPLLLAHGFGCDQTMWRYVVPAFKDNHRIVLFDYVGHGGADAAGFDPKRYARLDGYVQDVLDICHALDLSDVQFVGHSVSAMVGVLAAIREPDLFDRLVLIGPSPCYIDEGDYMGGFSRAQLEELIGFLDENPLGWSQAMAPAIMGHPDRPELSGELAASFCRTDPQVAKSFARVTFLSDNREDLPRLQTPALILQCSQDVIAPNSVGEYMHRHMPSSRLTILEATGHCPHLSSPDETIGAMKSFLEPNRSAQ